MTKPLPEPSSLLAGISHRDMLEKMRENDIFCSPDKFCRLLQWVQQRAIAQFVSADGLAVEVRVLGEEK